MLCHNWIIQLCWNRVKPTGISEMGFNFIKNLRDAIIMGLLEQFTLWDSFVKNIPWKTSNYKHFQYLGINVIFRPNFQMFLFLCMLKHTEVILWLEMYIKDKNRLLISKNKNWHKFVLNEALQQHELICIEKSWHFSKICMNLFLVCATKI